MDFKTVRMIRTVVLVVTWINMGFNGTMKFSCYPDLLVRTNSTVEELSVAFSVGAAGGLLIPFIAVIADKITEYDELILCTCGLLGAVGITLIGISTTVWQHCILNFIEGLAWYTINVVGQSTLLRLWGIQSDSAMQALHLGYPIGMLLAPLVAYFFVSDTDDAMDDGSDVMNVTASTLQRPAPYDATMTSQCLVNPGYPVLQPQVCYYSDVGTMEEPRKYDDGYFDSFYDNSSIGIAFAIAGLFTLSQAITHFAMYYLRPSGDELDKTIVTVSKESETETTKLTHKEMMSPKYWAFGETRYGILLMTLIILFFLSHLGSTYGWGYMVTYLTDSDLGFSNQEATLLQAAMNLSATFARASCIFITYYVNVNTMIIIELHGQVLMATLMLIFGTKYAVAMWVTSCVYVLFREPTWPSGTTWINNYIIMTNFLFSILSISMSIFSVFFNYAVGFLYTNVAPESIFYLAIIFGSLNCLVLYAMLLVTRGKPLRQTGVDAAATPTSDVGDAIESKAKGDLVLNGRMNDGFENNGHCALESTYL